MATRTDNGIRELSPEEWVQRVDEQARKYLGMSGEEFERRLRAGEIDIDDSPAVTRLAMMLAPGGLLIRGSYGGVPVGTTVEGGNNFGWQLPSCA
jgi:acyl CoA:acetate/3-ketoacid CoA transferase alpha subunit